MQKEDLEKAQIMFKLARKNNWGHKYDREEHFKRFQNLQAVLKDLSKIVWILMHKKPTFAGMSLNTEYKKEIIEFIEENMPYVKGMI